jgi:hypothetical protein
MNEKRTSIQESSYVDVTDENGHFKKKAKNTSNKSLFETKKGNSNDNEEVESQSNTG